MLLSFKYISLFEWQNNNLFKNMYIESDQYILLSKYNMIHQIDNSSKV